jgi:hypothetical protein
MAAIDKIYGTHEQWCELFEFLQRSKRPQYVRFMYRPFGAATPDDQERPITNTPVYVDRWLWDNCPLKFVKARLREVYRNKKP